MPERKNPNENIRFLQSPEVRGVSRDLVSDLRNIVDKWGTLDPLDMTRRVSDRNNQGLELHLQADFDITTLWVFKSTQPQSGITIIRTNLCDIWWDKELTAKDAKDMVKHFDHAGREMGFVDPKTGERLPLPPELAFDNESPKTWRVDEVFTNQGITFPAMGYDPLVLLQRFDRPEELVVEEIIVGDQKDYVIYPKKYAEYHQRRQAIAIEVLREKGLTLEDSTSFTVEEIMNFRAEIDRRLEEIQ